MVALNYSAIAGFQTSSTLRYHTNSACFGVFLRSYNIPAGELHVFALFHDGLHPIPSANKSATARTNPPQTLNLL
jgi:hypothetical protein